MSTEKNKCTTCELSCIWGKMRTIAEETAFQIALRNCSKEAGGKVSVLYDFSEGGARSQAHILAEAFC